MLLNGRYCVLQPLRQLIRCTAQKKPCVYVEIYAQIVPTECIHDDIAPTCYKTSITWSLMIPTSTCCEASIFMYCVGCVWNIYIPHHYNKQNECYQGRGGHKDSRQLHGPRRRSIACTDMLTFWIIYFVLHRWSPFHGLTCDRPIAGKC